MRDTPATATSSVNLREVVLSKITWRLVPFLFCLYVVAYVDRINIGFSALQLKYQIHLSDAGYGFAAGIFFAGYVLFQIPSNFVLERVGAPRWIAVLMIAWGLLSVCTILVRLPWQLYVLRFLLGAAEAGFFPGIIFYLRGWFPPSARARTMAIFAAGGAVSAIVAGPLCGALLNLNKAGLVGWQWMFLAEGTPAVILGFVVFFFLTNSPQDADWLCPEERVWLASEQLGQSTSVSSTRGISDWSSVWLAVAVYFGLNCAGYGITFWLPSLMHSVSHVSTIAIGFLTTIPYAAATVVMVVAGADSDRSGEQRWHIALPALLGAMVLVWAAYSSSLVKLIVLISFAVVAEFSMVGPFWALSSTIEPDHSGIVIALINSIGNLGGLAGSYAIGALRNSATGFRNGMICMGLSLGLAGSLALMIGRRDRVFAKTM
jgi:MFS transporter, ACS family, tartrate transporter